MTDSEINIAHYFKLLYNVQAARLMGNDHDYQPLHRSQYCFLRSQHLPLCKMPLKKKKIIKTTGLKGNKAHRSARPSTETHQSCWLWAKMRICFMAAEILRNK